MNSHRKFITPTAILFICSLFLSLSNQPISAEQAMGSGQVAAMIAGFVMVYSYIKFKLQ